jgi:MFS family permease
VPGFARLALALLLSRTANAMVALAGVLFVLERFHSAQLAGLTVFLSIAPGLLISPLAGALLDRHGRKWFIVLDYLVAACALGLIGVLGYLDRLPAWLLLLIAAISSLTGPLSTTGGRTLFPLIVPRVLWDRANAVDSGGYVVATLFGPPLAGALVAVVTGAGALVATGVVFALASAVMLGFEDPPLAAPSGNSIGRDALEGLLYTVRNPALRGLAFAITTLNLGSGVFQVLSPLLVFQHLHGGPALVGLMFGVLGVAGMAAGFVSGRVNTEGREREILTFSLLGTALGFLIAGIAGNVLVFALGMAILGASNGPMDVAFFSLRQRRTDMMWLGRAFAVSMALNFVGVPVGAALAGPLVAVSLVPGVAFCVATSALAAVFPLATIPKEA